MQIWWKLGSAFVKDIIDEMPEPKPAYNTVSTFVRKMEEKGFVGYEKQGKFHKYHPLISKEVYTPTFMKGVVQRYFRWFLPAISLVFYQRRRTQHKRTRAISRRTKA